MTLPPTTVIVQFLKKTLLKQYIFTMWPHYGLNPCLKDHEFHNLGRRLGGHHSHAFSFCDRLSDSGDTKKYGSLLL